MAQFNPFNYSLAEVQKALIALVGFGGFAAVFLFGVDFDPGLVPAIETLVPAAIAVGVAFAAKTDLRKALFGLVTAGVAVYRFFGNVDPSTEESLLVLAGYVATFAGVYFRQNAPVTKETAHRTQHRV
jgi:hypothetical protein